MSAVSPVGTLAYIIDEQALLVRVNNGWQYIAVSTKFFYILYHKIFIHYPKNLCKFYTKECILKFKFSNLNHIIELIYIYV